MPLTQAKRVAIIERDQQDLREKFGFLMGEFKALKWIAGSLWVPALVGLGITIFDHLLKIGGAK